MCFFPSLGNQISIYNRSVICLLGVLNVEWAESTNHCMRSDAQNERRMKRVKASLTALALQ